MESVYACSVTLSCLTLYDPMDCSPPGSSVHGISEAIILEWVAISSPRVESRRQLKTTTIIQASHTRFLNIVVSVEMKNSWILHKICMLIC